MALTHRIIIRISRCCRRTGKGGGCIDSRKKRKHQLNKELKAYAKAGMKLWLNGKPSTPSDIVQHCMVREEGAYMRDFISDDDQNITGIGFDDIK